MKKLLCILSVGLLSGIATYIALTKSNSKPNDDTNIKTDSMGTYTPKDVVHNFSKFDNEKNSTYSDISTMHTEASNIMKSSLENIFDDSQNNKQNDIKLKQLSNELDELLKEK